MCCYPTHVHTLVVSLSGPVPGHRPEAPPVHPARSRSWTDALLLIYTSVGFLHTLWVTHKSSDKPKPYFTLAWPASHGTVWTHNPLTNTARRVRYTRGKGSRSPQEEVTSCQTSRGPVSPTNKPPHCRRDTAALMRGGVSRLGLARNKVARDVPLKRDTSPRPRATGATAARTN